MASRKVLELALLNAKNDSTVENIKVYFQVARSYYKDKDNTMGADPDVCRYLVDYAESQLERITHNKDLKSIPCDICAEHPRERVYGVHRYIACKRYPAGMNREFLERIPCRYANYNIDLKEAEICPTLAGSVAAVKVSDLVEMMNV